MSRLHPDQHYPPPPHRHRHRPPLYAGKCNKHRRHHVHFILSSCLPSPCLDSFSSSTTRTSFLSSIRDRLTRVALGDNYERQRKLGGVLPADQAKQDYERQRDAALAAVSPDGTPLIDDVDSLPALQQNQRRTQRQSAKADARRLRKRWNATDAHGNLLEHKYSTAAFKISPRKLNMLAHQIAGKPIDEAILQMQFSAKRASNRIRSTLALARDHAEGKGMDVRRLVVSEAWVGKGRFLKRADIKGRARRGIKQHPEARLSIVLRYGKTWQQKELQRLENARRRVRAIGTGGVVRTDRKILNTYQRPGWAW